MFTKTDYVIAALLGFLVGVFVIPTVVNLGIRNYAVLLGLPIVIPIFWILGVWLGGFLSRWLPPMAQFSKFVAVGFSNTAIDFGILNILSATVGVTSGFIIGGVNIPGFSVAVINSYLWNKFWVFRSSSGGEGVRDFPTFLAVTLVGLLFNSGIVIFATTYVSPPLQLSGAAWLNLSKVLATVVSMVWNFFGYKFVVFRK